jgi:NADPH:quinone reductase-like Zn-dependent oxidoreductase
MIIMQTPNTMKAMIYKEYGEPSVLHLATVAKPSPKDDQVLIQIHATTVSSGDWHMRRADPFIIRLFSGLFRPKKQIIGVVLSGEVAQIGSRVTKFKVGDEVFGTTGMDFGTYAEFKCLPQDGVLALKPKCITHQEAAALPFGGNTANYFLKQANIQKDQDVLIYGASGSVGVAAVQMAKSYGAKVTAVCSTKNIEMVQSLGADIVIDYTKEDFSTNAKLYDVIFDTVGKSSYQKTLDRIKNSGYFLGSAFGLKDTFRAIWTSLTNKKKVKFGIISETAADVEFLKVLLESNKLKPIIDRQYKLEEIVEAHSYVEAGHKKGSVVITIVE